MGICESSKHCRNKKSKRNKTKNEDINKYGNILSNNTLDKMSKSLCKIILQSKKNEVFGIGFFINIQLFDKSINCLVTNYKSISEETINREEVIIMQLKNEKVTSINLDNTNRFIKNLKQPYNITIIEILDSDFISNDIDYLYYDSSYINGYQQYLNKDTLLLSYFLNSNKDDFTIGKIININDFGFQNSFNNENFSGFPIILLENQKIIGIYEKKYDHNGIFIGEIIKELERLEEEEKREKEIIIVNIKKSKDQQTDIQNEIILKYKINEDNNDSQIKILGNKFVENNKNNFKLIINDNENEIVEYLDIQTINNIKDNKLIEIKLKQINITTNISFMFSNCKSLLSISNFSNLNTSSIINMNSLFFGCTSLSSIEDISKWDTSNVITMNDLFSGCLLLTSLPDISNWDTSNVTNLSYFFSGCESLSLLPDISKWNTFNVKNMSYMFHYCKSLSNIPDISKWDTSNATDMSWMFSDCSSLTNLPDISKWKTNNVSDMNHMFYMCSSLLSLPNISSWNTNKVTDMSYMFNGCSNIKTFPDFSYWNTDNLKDNNQIFKGCKNYWKIKFNYVN